MEFCTKCGQSTNPLHISLFGEMVQAWCYHCKKISSPLAESDILSAGTKKAHNDIRQTNTAQLTNVGKHTLNVPLTLNTGPVLR